jgi:hypothetical protein
MKFVPNMLKKIETKSKHDLVKAVIGTIAGFVVEKLVENAYDSAFKRTKNDGIVISTEN